MLIILLAWKRGRLVLEVSDPWHHVIDLSNRDLLVDAVGLCLVVVCLGHMGNVNLFFLGLRGQAAESVSYLEVRAGLGLVVLVACTDWVLKCELFKVVQIYQVTGILSVRFDGDNLRLMD